ncbi:mechanosensitive ion channel family protein [Magnetospirillum sp. UT-4]|uniref:mechanosensitive ion channel family protein n=1 Tax=Magnetospirillum sp. UT-4 TaxID=2681467 RepID=UPI0013834D1A|nr:mechanosensitive ion channel domain-containing protein [Magnetospirillum sp. UT-4]CAA7621482.1 Mechanosensitive ion channel protein MscS [Magnetospirillum sp. UT-4]
MPEFSTVSLEDVTTLVMHWGISGAWALVILLAGWVLARWAERAVESGLARVRVADVMLRGFFASLARWALLAFTGVAVLEKLGVQTTSLVAILGAAGLAIGLALQGTLSNLAAGVMLLLFRPFKVGDGIEAGALAGTVAQVSLFHTILVTGDNIRVIAPNSAVWSAAIRNLSHLPTRKVEVVVPLPYGAEVEASMARIRALMAADSRIAAEPAPGVAVAKFGEKTVDVSATCWCATGDAGGVKAALMAAILKECRVGAA